MRISAAVIGRAQAAWRKLDGNLLMDDRQWEDRHWQSADGLELHFRDYPGRDDRPPILCIPGLTRNARDFEPVADAFAGEWRVIICDLRGRGDSEYAKDSSSYQPLTYVADILALMEQEKLAKAVFVGTSLGGIVTMLLAMQAVDKIAGAVINDIGPVVEAEGIARIREYVGHGRSYPTWMHAARSLRETASAAHPDFTIVEWLQHAKRLMCLASNGRITYDYDMRIAEPLAQADAAAPVDLWPAFMALAGRPVLALRGEISDILSARTLVQMSEKLHDCEIVTVPRVGHTPILNEPEVLQGIARLLAKVA